MRTNDGRHGDELSSFSKDSEVLKFLPVTDGLSLLIAWSLVFLTGLDSAPHPFFAQFPSSKLSFLGGEVVSFVITTLLYIEAVATLYDQAPCFVDIINVHTYNGKREAWEKRERETDYQGKSPLSFFLLFW